jgi:hypothetical protein
MNRAKGATWVGERLLRPAEAQSQRRRIGGHSGRIEGIWPRDVEGTKKVLVEVLA